MHYAVRRFAREYSLEGFCFVFYYGEEFSSCQLLGWFAMLCQQEARLIESPTAQGAIKRLHQPDLTMLNENVYHHFGMKHFCSLPPRSLPPMHEIKGKIIFFFWGGESGWSSLITKVLPPTGAINCRKTEKKQNKTKQKNYAAMVKALPLVTITPW